GDEGLEPLGADLVAERVERRAAEHRLEALAPARAELGPHEDRDPGAVEVVEEPLDDGLPEEPRDPRDQHVLAREPLDDRGRRAGPRRLEVVYHVADYGFSTGR